MGKAEERKEPTFPLSYWNDAVDIDLGPLPEHLKRPEQRGEEHAREEVASMAQTAVDQAMQQEAVTQAQPNSQRGKTWATQEAAPPQLEAPPPAKETQALTLGLELQAKYPQGVTLRTALEFEEFAYYIDYVRQVQQLRSRAAGLGSSSPAEPVAASTRGASVLAVPPSPAGPR
jgi:hypothetical protein